MHTPGDQASEVRHVDQVERTYFVRDLAHARKINDPRIGAAAADDQLRALFLCELLKIVVINDLSFLGHAIGNDAISFARKIQMMAMGEVSAMCQVQTEDSVTRLQHGR